jgi:hypothetical protein
LKWTQTGFVKPGTSTSANPIPQSVVHHASLIGDLTHKARDTCHRLLGYEDGDLQVLRLRTKENEIIVAPSSECTLVVLQDAHSAGASAGLGGESETAAVAIPAAGAGAGAAAEEKKSAA